MSEDSEEERYRMANVPLEWHKSVDYSAVVDDEDTGMQFSVVQPN